MRGGLMDNREGGGFRGWGGGGVDRVLSRLWHVLPVTEVTGSDRKVCCMKGKRSALFSPRRSNQTMLLLPDAYSTSSSHLFSSSSSYVFVCCPSGFCLSSHLPVTLAVPQTLLHFVSSTLLVSVFAGSLSLSLWLWVCMCVCVCLCLRPSPGTVHRL